MSKLINTIERGKEEPDAKKRQSIVEPFKERVIKMLDGGLSRVRIHEELAREGFRGSYSAVRRYIVKLNSKTKPEAPSQAKDVPKVKGKIKREAPSQRRHFRVEAPATVIIDNVKYNAINWSLGGFGINEFTGKTSIGDRMQAQFMVNFQDFEISFDNEIEVMRLSENGRILGVSFVDLSARKKELLNHFIESLLLGEMSSAKDTIKHIDIPVTPVSEGYESNETAKIPLRRRNVSRIIYSSIYLVAGVTLILYLFITLYGFFFRLDIESAVVTMPIEPIISQDLGRLKEVYVEEGKIVTAGQKLFHLEDDALTWALESGRLEFSTAKIELRYAEFKRKQEIEKLGDYEEITQHKLSSARETVAALTLQLQSAENELNRMKALYDADVESKQMVDEASANYARIEGALKNAFAELEIAEKAMVSVQNGNFYDGDRFVGNLPDLTANIEYTSERLVLAEKELNILEKRAERLTYRAPLSGRVAKIFKSPGSTVNRGETIILLEQIADTPKIDAFLTQDEVTHVQLGDNATVSIPALDERFEARVVLIDRTAGFINEMQERYDWRGFGDRSAYIQLVFTELTQEERNRLTGGMPAVLNIPKRHNMVDKMAFLVSK